MSQEVLFAVIKQNFKRLLVALFDRSKSFTKRGFYVSLTPLKMVTHHYFCRFEASEYFLNFN